MNIYYLYSIYTGKPPVIYTYIYIYMKREVIEEENPYQERAPYYTIHLHSIFQGIMSLLYILKWLIFQRNLQGL